MSPLCDCVLHADVAPEEHVALLDRDEAMIVVHVRRRTHFVRFDERLAVDARTLGVDARADAMRERNVLANRRKPAQLLAEIPATTRGKPLARDDALHILRTRRRAEIIGQPRLNARAQRCSSAPFNASASA